MDTVFDRIALEHDSAIEYTLSEEAKAAFYAFDEEWTRPSGKEDKSTTNSLKVILVSHVLLHRLTTTLSLQSTPTPRVISEETLCFGLTFFETLDEYSTLSELSADLNTSLSYKDVTEDDIMKKVFLFDGPFATPRRITNSFSSLSRPSSSTVKEVLEKLASEMMGDTQEIAQHGSSPVCVFFKVFPSKIMEENLTKIQMTRADYRESFQKTDQVLSVTQVARYTSSHPKGAEALRAELEME